MGVLTAGSGTGADTHRMNANSASLDARLRSLPDPALLVIGLAIVAALTAVRLTVGKGVPMIDFFLIPVAGTGWFARSRRYGYATAVVAATVSVVLAEVGPTQAQFGAALVAGIARLALYVAVLVMVASMRRLQTQHEREARTDALTGTYNARAFHDLGQVEVARSQRYRHEVSLAYIDIDDFKVVNDSLGHGEGDHVLGQTGHVLRTVVRSVDAVARLGGDEFVVLMPETRPTDARAVIERLRQDLSRLRTSAGGPVSCSIGLVTFDSPPVSLEELVGAGDDLMYRAKRNGKNRVEQAERAGSWLQTARPRGAWQ
jgi:diguanylate cyclase (GGDEF)-like protein